MTLAKDIDDTGSLSPAALSPQKLATISEYGDSGTEDAALRLRSGSDWNDLTLNYHFLTATPSYYSAFDFERVNFEAFNTDMRAATQEILAHISTFTDIVFTESDLASSQLTFGQALLPTDVGAWAYFPDPVDRVGGDVWINNFYSDAEHPIKGEYSYYLLLHEIGHSLGLEHTFEVGLTGVEDSTHFSVMAYDTDIYYPSSYMLYDIKALQNLYGANTNYQRGNNTYVLDQTQAYTVWDAAGIDTFDASHMTSDVVLNLNEGAFSSVGLSNNIAIAFDVVIENATGGSGNDKITGGIGNNTLLGNAGNDTFIANRGNDQINGGNNTDTLIFATDIENFDVSIVNAGTLTIRDLSTGLGTDTVTAVENYVFNGITYSQSDLQFYANGTDPTGRPLKPVGADLVLAPVNVDTVPDASAVNLSIVKDRTIGVAFETGSDVTSRQVIYEQGGGLRGLSIYVENGLLHHAAWNYRAGVQWGYKEITTAIEAGVRYTTTMIYDSVTASTGTMKLLLNGVEAASVTGIGQIHPDSSSTIGIGMLQDQGRFPEANVNGDQYYFTGDIDRIVYYDTILNVANLQKLQDHMEHDWLVNVAPRLENDEFTILTNTDTVFNVLQNDRDPNGDVLDVTSVTNPAHGDVTLRTDNTILYEPDNGYNGTDSFTYTVRDPDGLTSTATVQVTVTNEIVPDLPSGSVFALSPVNVNTVADSNNINLAVETDRTIGIAFQTGVDVTTRQVLFEQGGGLRGMSVYIENGKLHHAAWNYKAGVQWGYKEVTTDISANTRYTTTLLHDTTSSSQGDLRLYLNGVDEGSVTGVGHVYPDGSPTVGIGIMQDQGRFPDANFYGDLFAFTGALQEIVYYNRALNTAELDDLHGNIEHGWLVNVAPTPQNDTFTILKNTDTVLNVLANDSDPNGDTLDVISVSGGSHGDLTLNPDNTVLYEPDTGYEGADSFTYTVRDPDGLSVVATVNLTVTNLVIPDLPDGEVFELAPVNVNTVANAADINTGTVTDRTIGISFETGADVASRQVLFEQGGGLRGISIYIENGLLHHAAWNYKAGTQWGYKEVTTAISANTEYTTMLVLDTVSQSQGDLKLYLDGVLETSVSGVGYVYADGSPTVGIGIMQDQGRFPEANVYGDIYQFTGSLNRVVYYDEVLSSGDLNDLNGYLRYAPVAGPSPQALNIEDILTFDEPIALLDSDPLLAICGISADSSSYMAFTSNVPPGVLQPPIEV